MSWLLQSPPGLAHVLKREMLFAGALDRKQDLFIKRQRNHDLLFANKLKDESRLARLRIAEAVYRCPVFGRYKISKRQLDTIAAEMRALGTRRLVVQVAGRVFDRRDLGRWLEKEIASRDAAFDPEVEEEVWLFCIDEAYYFAIPVTKARDTDGRARESERHGSLPPPIAAAVAFAGMPKNDDVILDPVCGSGTLLSEAHAYAPEAARIGVDIDSEAIAIARANLGDDGSKLKLFKSDSRKLDIQGPTLTLANLPFGRQFGDKKDNPELYYGIIRETLRIANPERWRGVFLTSDVDGLKAALARIPGIESKELFHVKIRGELAEAVQIRRKEDKV